MFPIQGFFVGNYHSFFLKFIYTALNTGQAKSRHWTRRCAIEAICSCLCFTIILRNKNKVLFWVLSVHPDIARNQRDYSLHNHIFITFQMLANQQYMNMTNWCQFSIHLLAFPLFVLKKAWVFCQCLCWTSRYYVHKEDS